MISLIFSGLGRTFLAFIVMMHSVTDASLTISTQFYDVSLVDEVNYTMGRDYDDLPSVDVDQQSAEDGSIDVDTSFPFNFFEFQTRALTVSRSVLKQFTLKTGSNLKVKSKLAGRL